MTVSRKGVRPSVEWESTTERVIVIALLVVLLGMVICAVVILGEAHDIDKASITALLGTIGGGVVTAIVHWLSGHK